MIDPSILQIVRENVVPVSAQNCDGLGGFLQNREGSVNKPAEAGSFPNLP